MIVDQFSPLADWIQPQHLTAEAIASYHKKFEEHTVGFLQIENFFKTELATEIANFLVNHGHYSHLYALFSAKKFVVSPEVWQAADPDDLFYRFDPLDDNHPENEQHATFQTYRGMRRMCVKQEFCHYVNAITGVPLIGVRVEKVIRMLPGYYIKPHNDADSGRRLTFLLYFTPDWQPEYGGKLLIEGKDGSMTTVPTLFNSCVIFDMAKHYLHEVTPILDTAGDRFRLSMACRLHEPQKKKKKND